MEVYFNMEFFISFGLFIILITLYIFSISLYWKVRSMPYLIKYPIVASQQLLCLQVSIACFLEKVYNMSKERVVGFHILGQPGILLRDPELIKQILVKDFNNFSDKTSVPNFKNDPIGGRVLFKLPNPEWKIVRRQISPVFSTGKLKHMFPKIDRTSRNLIEYLQGRIEEVIDVKELCGRFSVDIISSCIYSIDGNCIQDENAVSRQIAKKVFACNFLTGIQFSYHFYAPALVKLFRMTFIHPSSVTFVQQMLKDIAEYRKKNNVNCMDFVDTLLKILEEKNYTSREAIIAQAAQMWTAGFETVGSSLTFALYELARHKDVQQKLRMNIISAMETHDGKLSYECINNMDYLDMVVCEIMRLYPIVPFVDRKTNMDYRIPSTNIVINKGTNVYVALLGLHYDPELFHNPHLFDPERFSTKNKQFIKAYTYLPFGDGPRNCIGMRFGKLAVKNALANIIANFEVEPEPFPGIKFDSKGFILATEGTIELRFRDLSEMSVV